MSTRFTLSTVGWQVRDKKRIFKQTQLAMKSKNILHFVLTISLPALNERKKESREEWNCAPFLRQWQMLGWDDLRIPSERETKEKSFQLIPLRYQYYKLAFNYSPKSVAQRSPILPGILLIFIYHQKWISNKKNVVSNFVDVKALILFFVSCRGTNEESGREK